MRQILIGGAWANKFFDAEQPWITRNTNKIACDNTFYQCVQIIANLAVLLSPFLPFFEKSIVLVEYK